jgi:hypothetical protein
VHHGADAFRLAGSGSAAAGAIVLVVPLAVLVLTPAIRPFRWSRLFWTYLVPVIPASILFDSVVSLFRIYTPMSVGRSTTGRKRFGCIGHSEPRSGWTM